MMTCFELCCPCLRWCMKKDGSLDEREPLMKRQDSYDVMKVKFRNFRKNVLENSLKDFDMAKEDIRDVTLLLSQTGIGNVDAQLSGYSTLYNDHLERWKNMKKLISDFKKSPAISEKSRVSTFRGALVTFHKICDDIKSKDSDLQIKSVSEFCLHVDYKMNEGVDDKGYYATILIFNQVNRDLREFIERGPSLARLLKSIAGGVRFQEGVTGDKTEENVKVQDTEETCEDTEEDEGGEPSDPLTSPSETTNKPVESHVEEETHLGICAERENLDQSISKASLTTDRRAIVLKKYKHNLEMLGRGSSIVEVLDLAGKSLWQNIHDELIGKSS